MILNIPSQTLPQTEEKTAPANQPSTTPVLHKILISLRNFGFTEAGRTQADPVVLASHLDDIRNGVIVDAGESEEEQEKIRQDIEVQTTALEKSRNEKLSHLQEREQVDIPDAEKKIKAAEKELLEIKIEKETQKNGIKVDPLNLYLYWTIFIATSLFLYGFYVSAFHSAFFKNVAAELATANSSNIGELLNTVFSAGAFREFNLHWLAPVIFFAFAAVLHIAYESESRNKWAQIVALLLIVLTGDCLIAYFIEYNSHQIQVLNGMAEANWKFYQSPRFYLVLFLGFLTCIGWSLILNAIKKEKAKSDLDSVYKLRITEADKEVSMAETKLNDFKKAAIALKNEILNIECEIDRLKKSLTSVQFNLHVLKKRISSFYSGWMTYVTNLADNETLRKTCEEVMIDFKHQYLAPAFVQNEAKPSEN
jgi:hypothetical protein